ncbi:YihY/virulence factor BrkB family protein [Alkalihalophilus marmarensis]|uniref:YihY/virulence factor BrkB family protein n=1 Tax=Alkalihalophilus marmarensis TaxID=521377 RepID=UPI002DB701AA|nr:YihY/virulence factor BrkB family protein [Alkalihalophilus marmarensis]MEC2074142.1 YihY/virulence factor BrkB family protein [Alkalihalophilus marmarensis]
MKKIISYGKALAKEFSNDNVPLLAAAQAYYYILSFIPMLILIFSIIPYLNFDPDQAMGVISSIMPDDTFLVFEEQILSILTEQRGGLLTVGIIGTIWSASNGMNAFIQAQNEAYNVKETRSFIKARLLSIALTLGMIVAFVVALILPVFGDTIINFIKSFGHLPDEMEVLFRVLRWALSITITVIIFAALYHFAPNVKTPFKHALPGAVFSTLSWQLTSLGFSIYISNFGNYSETYGSLGGIFILMLWFFLIGIILVVGAEINAIIYRKRKKRVLQDDQKTTTM